MRVREFLVEYNRKVTAQQVGDRVITALIRDTSLDLPAGLDTIRDRLIGLSNMDQEKLKAVLTPAKRQDIIDQILAGIESRDPTTNKAYTPWLAKLYAKGNLKLEDINRYDLLRLFDIAKKRGIIEPADKDINRYPLYSDLEATAVLRYSLDTRDDLLKPVQKRDEGKAKKVYEDGDVMIIVPEDENAACKYGRGTRWCTASTRGRNLFDVYNSQGRLYILIPKNPQHDGEKYQLHFESNSFMDEEDESVNILRLLTDRFSENVKNFFLNTVPSLKQRIEFMPDDILQEAIDSVGRIVQDKVMDAVSTWQMQDESYWNYLRDQGYVDAEDNIDWDSVEKNNLLYNEYNPEVDKWVNKIMSSATPEAGELKEFVAFETETRSHVLDVDEMSNIYRLPQIISYLMREQHRGAGEEDIIYFLEKRVSMTKEGDNYKAYILPSLRLPR